MDKLVEKYPEIQKAPVILKIPVLWGDMDSANHVNNLIYLKWAETSRIVLFEKFMDPSFQGSAGPILGWQDCKYIFPMTYPDVSFITCAVTEILLDRFLIETKIYSEKKERIAAVSKQSIIPYNYIELKKIALPDHWIIKLQQLMYRE